MFYFDDVNKSGIEQSTKESKKPYTTLNIIKYTTTTQSPTYPAKSRSNKSNVLPNARPNNTPSLLDGEIPPSYLA